VDAEEERKNVLAMLEADRARVEADIDQGKALLEEQTAKRVELETSIDELRASLRVLDEEANIQSFGVYKPRYDFGSSVMYQTKLNEIRERQKRMIKDKTAAVCNIEWTVNGSRVEGRKQTNQSLKLILRAFNGESDAAIARVKYNNIGVMMTRIRKAWEALNDLVRVQQCTISPAYLELKIEEIQLVHEYQEKLQAEKEAQRLIREQMREEELAQREMEKARQDAEREEKRYADALRKAYAEVEQAVGARQQKLLNEIELLQQRLTEAQANKERAIARAQMTRSGHVYVISNIGSFGEQVYKIGMTRRLDPMERVKELGDASVPFQFDVHAVIYSDDAPVLEAALHRAFQHRRVNRVNERKEFFRVDVAEIAEAVRQNHGEIEFLHVPDAEEYRKTVAIVAEESKQDAPATELAA
jgi:hypothetical protein